MYSRIIPTPKISHVEVEGYNVVILNTNTIARKTLPCMLKHGIYHKISFQITWKTVKGSICVAIILPALLVEFCVAFARFFLHPTLDLLDI